MFLHLINYLWHSLGNKDRSLSFPEQPSMPFIVSSVGQSVGVSRMRMPLLFGPTCLWVESRVETLCHQSTILGMRVQDCWHYWSVASLNLVQATPSSWAGKKKAIQGQPTFIAIGTHSLYYFCSVFQVISGVQDFVFYAHPLCSHFVSFFAEVAWNQPSRKWSWKSIHILSCPA